MSPANLLCVVRSESVKLSDAFLVTIDRRTVGADLEKAINEQRPFALDGKFVLWIAGIPTDGPFEDSIKNFDSLNRTPILVDDPLTICFPVPPRKKCLHVLVEILQSVRSRRSMIVQRHSIPDTTLPPEQPIDVKRHEYLHRNPPRAPSSLANLTELRTRQNST